MKGTTTEGHVVRTRAFEDFYRTQRGPLLRALALTLRDATLAADATEEAMARAYQRWDTVSHHRNPAGWTYTVGLNWARSWLRRRRREVFGRSKDPVAFDREPSDPVVIGAVAGLSERHRAVVVLRLFMDWSVDDTADALGIKPGTVKSRMSRALSELREILEVER